MEDLKKLLQYFPLKEDNSTDFKPICPEGYILLETNFIMKAGLTGFYHEAHQKLK